MIPEWVDGRTIMFAMLAGLAGATAIGVVAFGNAVRSALCLVLNFFTLALLYFTLDAEMLGVTQVIVYTGAIMVLQAAPNLPQGWFGRAEQYDSATQKESSAWAAEAAVQGMRRVNLATPQSDLVKRNCRPMLIL